jgi:hypothetical protein
LYELSRGCRSTRMSKLSEAISSVWAVHLRNRPFWLVHQ